MAYSSVFASDKLKTYADIIQRERHNCRYRIPHNANPDWLEANRDLVPLQAESLDEAIHDRIGTARIRKNAVLAVEIVLTAKSKFFEAAEGDTLDFTQRFTASRLEKWIELSMNFLRQEFGEKNLVHCVLHLDETSPHIHAIVVPMIDGRLSAAHYFDGGQKMRDYHTRYAKAVSPLGLKRGRVGSTATHTTLREYHAAVAAAHAEAPTVPAPPTPPAQRRRFLGRQTTDEKAEAAEYEKARAAYDAAHAERVAWLEEHADALLARSAELDRVQAELERQTERATRERARADEIAAEYERYRAEMPRIRALPLADAIRGCGLAAKKVSDSEWIYKKKTLHIDKADPSRGTVTEDGAAPVKVRGGIDLIKNFKGLEAKEAAVFLARHLSVSAVQEDAEAAARERAREWCAGEVVPAVEAEQAAEQRRKAGLEAKRKARAATARSSSTARPSTPRPSASRPSPAEVWREREQRIAARYALAAEASRAQHQQQKMRG